MAYSPSSATVEIFSDYYSQIDDRALGAVHASLGYLAEATDPVGLELTRDTRRIRIGNDPDTAYIDVSKVRFPKFPADINIILTNRELALDETDYKARRRQFMGDSLGGVALGNVALLTTSIGVLADRTVHEVGHLLGLKKTGDEISPDMGHCSRRDCVMHESLELVTLGSIGSSVVRTARNWFGVDNSGQAAYHGKKYCEECSGQARRAAFGRALVRDGIHVPGL